MIRRQELILCADKLLKTIGLLTYPAYARLMSSPRPGSELLPDLGVIPADP